MKSKVIAFILILAVAVIMGGWLIAGDHQADRNVPGGTTTVGKNALTD